MTTTKSANTKESLQEEEKKKEFLALSEKSHFSEHTRKKLFEEVEELKQKNTKKSEEVKKKIIIFSGIGGVIFLVALFFHTFPQFMELQRVKSEIQKTEQEIDERLLQKVSLEQTLKEVQSKKIQLEKSLGKTFPIVFPQIRSKSEYQSAINRLAIFFEDFSLFYGKRNSPLHLPSISFGTPREDKVNEVFVVPIKMTVEASEENFILFIDQINARSGSLDEEDFYLSSLSKKKEPIQLMSVDSLNIMLPQSRNTDFRFSSEAKTQKQDAPETLTFSLSLSAYFQVTDEMQEMFGSKK